MKTKNIQHYLINSSQAQIIIDNNYCSTDNLQQLNLVIKDMLQDSHEMPALGVAIHTEILKNIKQGVWLKLQYNGTQYVNDMPFDELLIEVDSDFGGFNIIRGNKGIYDGRCFYVDLVGNSMKLLYDFINLNYMQNY